MARVKYYDQASQEWKYADAALNMKGKDGYTPQKGIDYFTEEDVRELTENVLDQGVLTYNEQELTEDQKAQARENIGIDQISFDKLTENLDADGFRITNLPLPQSGSEPATREFVENFTFEGSTYVATDDGEGNVVIRPYQADEDELVFNGHIQNKDNPHGVTAAQVGAATHADINAAVKTAAPRNLLDNSDFRNPVNQRGVIVSSNGLIVDRWYAFNRTDGTNDTATLTADGIVTNGASYLQQRIPKGIIKDGEKYTLAVHYSDGTVDVNTNGEYMIFDGFDLVNYITSNGKTIASIALYEGEYTIDTLPKYQPKGYGAELVECQRYYQIINNGIGSVRTNEDKILVTLPLCVSMRNEISVASATIATVRANGLRIDNPEFEINAIAYVDYYSACVLELAGTFTGMRNGIAYIDGRFHLSAEFL